MSELSRLTSSVGAAVSRLHRVSSRLSAVDGRGRELAVATLRVGLTPVPALPPGNTDVMVVWLPRPMPDATYQVFPSVAGAGPLLGAVVATVRFGQRTPESAVVTLTNIGAEPIAEGLGVLWALAANPAVQGE